MFGFSLIGIILNPRVLGMIAILAVVGFGVWKWKDMEKTILEQRYEIEELEDDLVTKTLQLELAGDTQIELENRLESEAQLNENLNIILGDINNATAEEDGPIAPVLRNTLDAIDRLRDDT